MYIVPHVVNPVRMHASVSRTSAAKNETVYIARSKMSPTIKNGYHMYIRFCVWSYTLHLREKLFPYECKKSLKNDLVHPCTSLSFYMGVYNFSKPKCGTPMYRKELQTKIRFSHHFNLQFLHVVQYCVNSV